MLILTCFLSSFMVNGQGVFDLYTVHEIRISIPQQNWDSLLNNIKQKNLDQRLIATITWDGATYDSVGVRYKGNSSYHNVRNLGVSKLPFNLKINEIRKNQSLPDGVTTLKLSNIFRDPSFVREALSYEIARQYTVAPQCNFVRVFVNNKPMGLYNNSESIDERFVGKNFDKNFDKKNTILLKCDPDWKAPPAAGCPPSDKASLMYLGEDSTCYAPFYDVVTRAGGWKELAKLSKILTQKPEQIEEILDVDATLWMLAFNNFLVNLDSYLGLFSHNYYLFLQENGLFVPLIWDLNLCFGGFRLDGSNPGALTNEQMQQLSPMLHAQNPKRPLISQLLKNEHYKKIYLSHLRTILNEQSKDDKYLKRAIELQKMIEKEVQKDNNRLYPIESFAANISQTVDAGKNTKIIGIQELMNARISYLKAHPLLSPPPPTLSDGKASLDKEEIKLEVRAQEANKVFCYYRTAKKAKFNRIELTKNADRAYFTNIKKENYIQYYFVAENEKTAALLPEKAAKAFLEANF